MNEVVSIQQNDRCKELVDLFLSGRKTTTLKAYQQDLLAFAKFLGVFSSEDAVKHLLTLNQGEANLLVFRYKNGLIERKLSSNTINRRLAALRSMLKLARLIGFVTWTLEIPNQPSQSYRDTKGPSSNSVEDILKILDAGVREKLVRDGAIVCLLMALALRNSEVINLDLEDYNAGTGILKIMGKGRSEKQAMSLPSVAVEKLNSWIAVRGAEQGPLFPALDNSSAHLKRMTANGLYKVIRKLGEMVNIKTRPHAFRHFAITQGLKVCAEKKIRIDEMLQFSRHKSLAVLLVYADHEKDVQGEISNEIVTKFFQRSSE